MIFLKRILKIGQLLENCWIEDDSNTDIKLDRNFIRHKILPKLEQRWPKAKLKFARASNFCQQAMRVIDQNIDLDKYLEQDLNKYFSLNFKNNRARK